MENKRIISVLSMLLFVLSITSLSAQEFVPGKLYIKINDPLGIPQIETKGGQVAISMQNSTLKNIYETYGVYEFIRAFPLIDQINAINKYGLDQVYLLKCTGDQETLLNAIILNQSGEYDYVEQIPQSYDMYTPNDYHLLDGTLGADSALNLIKAQLAWDITKGDSTILVGMNEKGSISLDHPDLANKVQVLGNMQYNNPYHGDFVAGCIAAKTDNNTGKSGIGFNCKILYKQHYQGYDTSEWINMYLNGAKIINISWATPSVSTTSENMINFLTDRGVLFIAGAGNGHDDSQNIPSDTTFLYPASYANVLSVTSVDNSKHHLYSNGNPPNTHTHNDSVDVSAPGRDVLGLAPAPYYYGRSHGTSFSAPYVSGVAGLIYSINPCLTPQQVTHIIKSTTENIDAQNPDYIGLIGTGLVDAYAAVLLTQQKYAFNSYTISNGQNIIWDSLMYCSQIVVEDGGILQINPGAELVFADTSKIIVETGGELIIRGGKLTKSNCADFWQGIEVRGNSTLSQVTQNQGAVRVMNNAIIEYAVCGIRAYGMENGVPIANSGGGIVLATGGKFLNNKIAIKINDYAYVNPLGYPQINESVILSNTIEINNDYYLKTEDDPIGIYLSSVKQVAVNGNAIQNTTSNYTGIGTYIFSADALLSDYLVPNTFSGWDYGVKALGTRSSNTITLEDNVFELCNTAVYLSSITNITAIFNQFEMGINQTGLYLDNCNDFIVEENSFQAGYNPVYGTNSFGLVINNSGPYINEIYKNNFDHIKYASLAQNQNRATNGDGLSFKCNTFTDNGFDISVTADTTLNNLGIAGIQGSTSTLPDGPAGNIFSRTGPFGTPTDLNNEESFFTYYYHDDQTEHLKPEYFTYNTIHIEAIDAEWNENSCPSNYTGGGSGGGIEEIRSLLTTSGLASDSLNTIYQLLKDGGNTQALTTVVDNSTPPHTIEVYNELLNTSPYLSDSVVGAAIIKEDVLPNAMLRDIMVANPQSAKSSELVETIDQRSNPMPEYMIAQILQGKSLIGSMENLLADMAYYKQNRAKAYQLCVNYYLNDTLNPQASFDSLLSLLSNENRLEARYQLAAMQLETGDISNAMLALNNIPVEFNLNSEETETYEMMLNYFNLLIELQQNGTTFSDLSEQQLALLADLQYSGIGLVKSYARNALRHLGLTNYTEPYIIPNLNKSANAQSDEQQIKQSLDDFHYIKVFPNPAKDYVIVEYTLESATDFAQLQLFEATGKLINTQSIHGIQDQKQLNTSNLKSGEYMICLIVNNKILETIKLSIVK